MICTFAHLLFNKNLEMLGEYVYLSIMLKFHIFQIHALITGPFDTPYEGGFFYFIIRCPPDYPIRAPRVKLMTTGDNQVRFNPNLYKNGKVCLSILGYVYKEIWQATPDLYFLHVANHCQKAAL